MLCFVDRKSADSVPLSDRALQFGEGLFETIRFRSGQPILWEQHWARLQRGAQVLSFPALPDSDGLCAFLKQACEAQSLEDVTVKVLYSRRGRGGAGYRAAPDDGLRELLWLRPYNGSLENQRRLGVHLPLLSWKLAADPQLGGLKHLNRLPQVMASRELGADDFDGLLTDSDGYCIESTRANLFFYSKEQWSTPDLRDAGVAGTLRAQVLEAGMAGQMVAVRPWLLNELDQVDAALIGNSVMGLLPIAQLGERTLSVADHSLPACQQVNRSLGFEEY